MNEHVAILLERSSPGLLVRLMRDNAFGTLSVMVRDGSEIAKEQFLRVTEQNAKDAFLHPFAYLGHS